MNYDSVSGSTAGSSTNCSVSSAWWPQYYSTVGTYFPCRIRPVANGFIVELRGIDYVFTEMGQVNEFLAKELSGGK